MKILLLADFGGAFSEGFRKHLKGIDFDIALAAGDFADIKAIRELFFKYGQRSDEMYDRLPEKEKIRIRRKRSTSTDFVLRKLNSLGRPVCIVTGNNEIYEYESFLKILSKYNNCKLLDGGVFKYRGLTVIGNRCEHQTRSEEMIGITEDQLYMLQEKFLERSFRKFGSKKTILLTHYPPYRCKLDKLPETNPLSPGKHIGSYLIQEIVKNRQPPFVVTGHLEEYQDMCKIGKTIIINPGEGGAGKYGILDVNKKDFKKSKIEFFHFKYGH